ncbi:outer membrane protein assembly factor BamE [Methylomonas sp. MED-D]|uniref:outer membrane protein assembly factor BamE n=1 Tax=unclassified Methylomonas TaxID=2608980 RepID=UPI0028A48539|nr:outer membrane protein assembly factor BamE [Methylomonas sp. MV1]MDT4329349.1 outer membrane protein assembly factor BamE [Methylomonas sp. MV1]
MKKLAVLLAAGLALPGCSTILNNLPGVYSLDIEQGNIIDQSMVDQLRPNMTKRQVLYIMGSPMLADAFHERRWDYLYSEQPSGEDRVQKRISLFFNGENLMGVQGDFRPSSLPVVKESTETSVDLPKRELDRSMWEKISGIFSDEPDTLPRRTGAANSTDAKPEPAAAEKGKEILEEDVEQ